MAQLYVNNKILNYKGISYQIPQISSLKIVEIKKKRIKPEENDETIKTLSIAVFITFLLTIILLQNFNFWGLITGLICAGLIYILVQIFKEKWEFEKGPKFNLLFGLSLRMSNGDDPLFVSKDKNTLIKVRDAIFSAMNGENENLSVNFDNVNIEITDSENIEIGNIVGG